MVMFSLNQLPHEFLENHNIYPTKKLQLAKYKQNSNYHSHKNSDKTVPINPFIHINNHCFPFGQTNVSSLL